MARHSTDERRYDLAQIIVSEGHAKVGQLAEHFGVSTETIRKDLIYLEEEGIAKKAHGRAFVSSELAERPYTQKLSENAREKVSIAKKAMEMIPKRGAIFLDAGSTIFEFSKLLTLQIGLSIFTNNLTAMPLLAQSNNSVYLVGGKVRSDSMAIIGDWALDALNSVQVDVAFLGTDGFLMREGPCSASFEEVGIKRAMINQSTSKFLLADYSKFMRNDMFTYAQWKDIDAVITDDRAPASELERIGKFTKIIISSKDEDVSHKTEEPGVLQDGEVEQ